MIWSYQLERKVAMQHLCCIYVYISNVKLFNVQLITQILHKLELSNWSSQNSSCCYMEVKVFPKSEEGNNRKKDQKPLFLTYIYYITVECSVNDLLLISQLVRK